MRGWNWQSIKPQFAVPEAVMTGEVESGSPEQITIMVLTTAVQFACGFGLIALVVFGLWRTFTETLTIPELIGFPLCFGLTLATGYKAMMLVCRPTRAGMVGVGLMSVASIAVAICLVL
jgi:hypothetical protein